VGTSPDLEFDFIMDQGIENVGEGRDRGQGSICLDLEFLGTFYNSLQFAQMPKATGRNSKKNVPTMSSNRSMVARHLPGYQRCWCRSFNVGCGRVSSLRMRQHHALKERKELERVIMVSSMPYSIMIAHLTSPSESSMASGRVPWGSA